MHKRDIDTSDVWNNVVEMFIRVVYERRYRGNFFIFQTKLCKLDLYNEFKISTYKK